MPQEELIPEAEQILGVEGGKITAVIDQLEHSEFIKRERILYTVSSKQYSVDSKQSPSAHLPTRPLAESAVIREEQAIYLVPLYYSEVGVTQRVQRMIGHPTSRLAGLRARGQRSGGAGEVISNLQSPVSASELSAQQQEAVTTAVIHKVTVLTGGPGTGKTTTLRSLIELLDRTNHSYVLASPTGRAAKRLAEATGREAKTIHRLLEFKPGEGFGRHEHNPIDADMIVIDEASMLDVVLANNLLKAIGPDSHLLLVGDVDQLPSVGAGDVLGDLIDSGVTAVIRLQTIFRQAANSLIIQNSHRINQGQMPLTPKEAKDFFLFVKPEPDEAAELLVDIVKNRLPQKFRLDPMEGVQVLSPMYNGSLGVTNLNHLLQAALNPPDRRKLERRLAGRLFRVGDKVMQTVNNYDKDVYNGDIGHIVSMDMVQQTMTVNIDGAPVVYDFMESDELVHAYAISVHKSQGAEYSCVVLPVMTQHYLMLQRNLLYTAVTRAKKVVVLIGTRKALNIAIKNNKVSERHTALDWRLKR
jgi:exodeoxyribonuclease V alpha subunit